MALVVYSTTVIKAHSIKLENMLMPAHAYTNFYCFFYLFCCYNM